MDDARFDRIARALGAATGRRRVLQGPLVAALGGLLAVLRPEGAAADCLDDGARCGGGRGTCCSGWCKKKRNSQKKFCKAVSDRGICTIEQDRCEPDGLLFCGTTDVGQDCHCTVTKGGRSRCSSGDVHCVQCSSNDDCVAYATANSFVRPTTWACLRCSSCFDSGTTTACAASCETPDP